MLRQRARAFTSYFKKLKKSSKSEDNVDSNQHYLSMESLFSENSSAKNLRIFQDSSSEEDNYENLNETIFKFHKRTGEWVSYDSDSNENSESVSFLAIFWNFVDYLQRQRQKVKKTKRQRNEKYAFTALDSNSSESDLNNSDNSDSDTPLIAV